MWVVSKSEPQNQLGSGHRVSRIALDGSEAVVRTVVLRGSTFWLRMIQTDVAAPARSESGLITSTRVSFPAGALANVDVQPRLRAA
jgi:hypothetical protein